MSSNIIVSEIKQLFTVSSPKGRIEKIQNRKHFGLSFCTEGQITYTHNGEKTVSDVNHAVILPKGLTYTLKGDKSGSFPVINFNCVNAPFLTIRSFPIENIRAYTNDFEKMKSLSLLGGNQLEMMSIFYHMLHRIFSQNSNSSIVMPAMKYIEKNYGNPSITNKQLAQLCNISEVYFRRVFSEMYKMTPKQFLIDLRVNKAKQMLSEGCLKIGAIAEKCGFSNQYHFCRVIKEKTGLTPTDYMNQNRLKKI